MAKIFTYRGKTKEQLEAMSLNELLPLLPARTRRSLRRGQTDAQKSLFKKIKAAKAGKYKKQIKTHCRDAWIIPEMFGLQIGVHNGKEFIPLDITPEMVGHALGDFILPTRDVKHAAPGIGATRGSKAVSVK